MPPFCIFFSVSDELCNLPISACEKIIDRINRVRRKEHDLYRNPPPPKRGKNLYSILTWSIELLRQRTLLMINWTLTAHDFDTLTQWFVATNCLASKRGGLQNHGSTDGKLNSYSMEFIYGWSMRQRKLTDAGAGLCDCSRFALLQTLAFCCVVDRAARFIHAEPQVVRATDFHRFDRRSPAQCRNLLFRLRGRVQAPKI
jgi:hypothetical protein